MSTLSVNEFGLTEVRTIEEMINYLTQIKEEHGNIPLYGSDRVVSCGISTGKPLDENYKVISEEPIKVLYIE